jgi:hypothetical protein
MDTTQTKKRNAETEVEVKKKRKIAKKHDEVDTKTTPNFVKLLGGLIYYFKQKIVDQKLSKQKFRNHMLALLPYSNICDCTGHRRKVWNHVFDRMGDAEEFIYDRLIQTCPPKIVHYEILVTAHLLGIMNKECE